MFVRSCTSTVLALGIAATAHAASITVPSTGDLWLAGMPNGTVASYVDVAPDQSPALVPFAITPGMVFIFNATGLTDHCVAFGCGAAGPEGDPLDFGITAHDAGAENGIGNVVAMFDSLIGVFLGPDQPDLTGAPGTLDFSTPGSRDFASLSPLLKQPFYIGDGFRNDGVTQQLFVAPAGATRLYLGVMDSYEWNNNTGSLQVTASPVPEPSTVVLVGLGIAAAAGRRRILGRK